MLVNIPCVEYVVFLISNSGNFIVTFGIFPYMGVLVSGKRPQNGSPSFALGIIIYSSNLPRLNNQGFCFGRYARPS